MTSFVIVAAVMAAVALAWLLPTLLRRRDAPGAVQSGASNLAIIKDQLAELEADLAAGTVPRERYQQAREDLERRALDEAHDAATPVTVSRTRTTAVALSVVVPLAAAAIYWQLGSPQALIAGAGAGAGVHAKGNMTPQDVEAMVAKLAARLQETPDDGNGWALLGRSYLVMRRPAEAIAAYERAAAIITDNADLLADYADALALGQDRRIEGKPLEIIERVLKIDPYQWKALAMAGSAAFDRKDYKKAVAYWERLQARTEPGSDFAREVAANIEEARQLGGIKAPAKLAQAPVAPKSAPAPAPAAPAPGAGARVEGSVTLSRELAGKAAPSDTVFVFARAAEGPRMPLAIRRYQVKDLPAKFSLDDSLAMSPAMKLSNFPVVVIGARVSKAGSATPQPGDLQGFSKPVKVGTAGIAIVINEVVP
jgi:cytochrome c-type biogenesis protein CcmH